MTRERRIVLWILTVLLLAALVTPALGFYPPVVLLVYGWWLVLPAMAWGMLDAAYHRDSVWHEADQNKIVWVLVQFIPLVGRWRTTSSYTRRCWGPKTGCRA